MMCNICDGKEHHPNCPHSKPNIGTPNPKIELANTLSELLEEYINYERPQTNNPETYNYQQKHVKLDLPGFARWLKEYK